MINKDDYQEDRQQILMMTTKQIITINNYHDNNQHDHNEADPAPSPSLSPSWSTTSSIRMTLTATPPAPRRPPTPEGHSSTTPVAPAATAQCAPPDGRRRHPHPA